MSAVGGDVEEDSDMLLKAESALDLTGVVRAVDGCQLEADADCDNEAVD